MQILCFLIALLSTHAIRESQTKQFIVWNVGQGAWSTLVEKSMCIHIDMGGTQFTSSDELKRLCRYKKNYLLITHFDQDHINLLPKANRLVGNICVITPLISALSQRKKILFLNIPQCKKPPTAFFIQLQQANYNERNDSNIYIVNKKILVTGDASIKNEKVLLTHLELKQVQYYILGHHGSRTSTSSTLLDHLPNLKLTIGSSWKKKYGHPHIETLRRLQQHYLPVITTELYGSIFINLDDYFLEPLKTKKAPK